jgi:hypothetical protein
VVRADGQERADVRGPVAARAEGFRDGVFAVSGDDFGDDLAADGRDITRGAVPNEARIPVVRLACGLYQAQRDRADGVRVGRDRSWGSSTPDRGSI